LARKLENQEVALMVSGVVLPVTGTVIVAKLFRELVRLARTVAAVASAGA
jgi:hypothetical protein